MIQTTNQEKFIQTYGMDMWQDMIVATGLSKRFKEFWTSPWDMREGEQNE